jgi:hypothetical protein
MGKPNFLRRRETFTKKLPANVFGRVRDGSANVFGRVRDGSAKKFLMGVGGWSGKKKVFCQLYTTITHQLYTLKNLKFTYFYTNLPLKNDEFKKGV